MLRPACPVPRPRASCPRPSADHVQAQECPGCHVPRIGYGGRPIWAGEGRRLTADARRRRFELQFPPAQSAHCCKTDLIGDTEVAAGRRAEQRDIVAKPEAGEHADLRPRLPATDDNPSPEEWSLTRSAAFPASSPTRYPTRRRSSTRNAERRTLHASRARVGNRRQIAGPC